MRPQHASSFDCTVVIPCYNATAFLLETLACIPMGIAVIAIDDGSIDATLAHLVTWQQMDPEYRCVLQHKENKGLGAARNSGWEAAKTTWILFLDADDLLEASWADALRPSLPLWESSTVWAVNPYAEWDGQMVRKRHVDSITQTSDLVTKRLPFSPSGSLLKKEVLHEMQGWSTDRNMVEDIDLWMRLWRAGHRPYTWSSVAWTRYRTNIGLTKDVHHHAQKVLKRIQWFIDQGWVEADLLPSATHEIWRQVGRTHHKLGRWQEARTAYALAKPTLMLFVLRTLTYLHIAL